MRLNRLARQKEEKQIFWFWPKHAKLYYYLLQIYIFLKERERKKEEKKKGNCMHGCTAGVRALSLREDVLPVTTPIHYQVVLSHDRL